MRLRARASARCFVPSALRRFRLELPSFARLHVMATSSQLTKDARLLHLALERLERPVVSVGFGEMNFRHESVDLR